MANEIPAPVDGNAQGQDLPTAAKGEIKPATEPLDTPQDRALKEARAFVVKTYNVLFSYNFAGALIVAALLCGVVIFKLGFGGHGEPSIFLISLAAGAMGAFMSALTRMYRFTDLPQVIVDDSIQLGRLTLAAYSLTPALVGTISSAILYFAFAGGLLSGSVFPTFSCPTGKTCTSFTSLIESHSPKDASDYAKMIFWSIVAGFSERLVPDLVDRLSRSASEAPRDKPRS